MAHFMCLLASLVFLVCFVLFFCFFGGPCLWNAEVPRDQNCINRSDNTGSLICWVTRGLPYGPFISSFVKYMFKYFAHFYLLGGFLLLIWRNSLYIRKLLYQISRWKTNTFFSLCDLVFFHFLNNVFLMGRSFKFW